MYSTRKAKLLKLKGAKIYGLQKEANSRLNLTLLPKNRVCTKKPSSADLVYVKGIGDWNLSKFDSWNFPPNQPSTDLRKRIYRNLPLGNLNDEKGPLSKLRKSYNLTLSELIPTAKIRPSGSKAATGLPARFMKPWQYCELRKKGVRE